MRRCVNSPGSQDPSPRNLTVTSRTLITPLLPSLPPLSSSQQLINILWCILGWIPGVIHAFLICLSDTRCNTCTTDLAMTQSPGSTIDQMMVTRTPPVVVGVPTLVQPVVVVASDRPQGVTVVE